MLPILVAAAASVAVPAMAQPVYFNHAYVDLAPATIDAIKASSFLHDEFSTSRVSTTVANGGKESWTGLYFYGERTYLEFFPAGGPEDPLGKIGIGLSIDDRRQLPELAKRMSVATGATVEVHKQTKINAGVEIDWFDVIAPDYSGRETFLHDAWIMAVYPSYLRKRYPDIRAVDAGTSRQKLLARQYDPTRLLRDVTSIDLTLPATEGDRLIKQLRGSGYTITQDINAHVASGPDFRFVISPVRPDQPRSVTFHLALNRAAKPQVIELGGSVLTLHHGPTATWHFPAVGEAMK